MLFDVYRRIKELSTFKPQIRANCKTYKFCEE
jgi:hypothetical protein